MYVYLGGPGVSRQETKVIAGVITHPISDNRPDGNSSKSGLLPDSYNSPRIPIPAHSCGEDQVPVRGIATIEITDDCYLDYLGLLHLEWSVLQRRLKVDVNWYPRQAKCANGRGS